MAGHGLLPGCQRAWNHDECPGYLDRRPDGWSDDEPWLGGLVCHCPCHRLRQVVADLEEKLGRTPGRMAELNQVELGHQLDQLDPGRRRRTRPPTAPGGPPTAAG